MPKESIERRSQLQAVVDAILADSAKADGDATELLMFLGDPVWVLGQRGYEVEDKFCDFLESRKFVFPTTGRSRAGFELAKRGFAEKKQIPILGVGNIKLFTRTPGQEISANPVRSEVTAATPASDASGKDVSLYNLGMTFPLARVQQVVSATSGRASRGYGGLPDQVSAGGRDWFFRDPKIEPADPKTFGDEPGIVMTVEVRGVKGANIVSGTMSLTGKLSVDDPGHRTLAAIVAKPEDFASVDLRVKGFTAAQNQQVGGSMLQELKASSPKVLMTPLFDDPRHFADGAEIEATRLRWKQIGNSHWLELRLRDSEAPLIPISYGPDEPYSGGDFYISSADVCQRFGKGIRRVLPAVLDNHGNVLDTGFTGSTDSLSQNLAVLEDVTLKATGASKMSFESTYWIGSAFDVKIDRGVFVNSTVEVKSSGQGLSLVLKEFEDGQTCNYLEELLWMIAMSVVGSVAGIWGTAAAMLVKSLRDKQLQEAADQVADLSLNELMKVVQNYYKLPGGRVGEWAGLIVSLCQMGFVLRDKDVPLLFRPASGASAFLPSTPLYRWATYRIPSMGIISSSTLMETLTCCMSYTVAGHIRKSDLGVQYSTQVAEYESKVEVHEGSLEHHVIPTYVYTVNSWDVTFAPYWFEEVGNARRIGPVKYAWFVDGKAAGNGDSLKMEVDVSKGDVQLTVSVHGVDVFGVEFPQVKPFTVEFKRTFTTGPDIGSTIDYCNHLIQGVIGPDGFSPIGPGPHIQGEIGPGGFAPIGPAPHIQVLD